MRFSPLVYFRKRTHISPNIYAKFAFKNIKLICRDNLILISLYDFSIDVETIFVVKLQQDIFFIPGCFWVQEFVYTPIFRNSVPSKAVEENNFIQNNQIYFSTFAEEAM
jgi:hypothetical protein